MAIRGIALFSRLAAVASTNHAQNARRSSNHFAYFSTNSSADSLAMSTDPLLCHLFVWALARLPVEWLVRDIEMVTWRWRVWASA